MIYLSSATRYIKWNEIIHVFIKVYHSEIKLQLENYLMSFYEEFNYFVLTQTFVASKHVLKLLFTFYSSRLFNILISLISIFHFKKLIYLQNVENEL